MVSLVCGQNEGKDVIRVLREGCRILRQCTRFATVAVAACDWRSFHYGGGQAQERVGTIAT